MTIERSALGSSGRDPDRGPVAPPDRTRGARVRHRARQGADILLAVAGGASRATTRHGRDADEAVIELADGLGRSPGVRARALGWLCPAGGPRWRKENHRGRRSPSRSGGRSPRGGGDRARGRPRVRYDGLRGLPRRRAHGRGGRVRWPAWWTTGSGARSGGSGGISGRSSGSGHHRELKLAAAVLAGAITVAWTPESTCGRTCSRWSRSRAARTSGTASTSLPAGPARVPGDSDRAADRRREGVPPRLHGANGGDPRSRSPRTRDARRSGANLLGFLAGAEIVRRLPEVWLGPAALVVIGLNVLAETVTLSRTIEAIPPLRWFDRLGRLPE